MFCNRVDLECCNFTFLACNFHESLAIRFLKNYVLFLTDVTKIKDYTIPCTVVYSRTIFPGPVGTLQFEEQKS